MKWNAVVWICLILLLFGCGAPVSDPVPTHTPSAPVTQAEPIHTPKAPPAVQRSEAPAPPTPQVELPAPPVPDVPEPDALTVLLQEMTLQEKVGQLFLIRPEALTDSANGETMLTDALREGLLRYPVGGIVMFGKNLTSPVQITEFLKALQSVSKTPLFLAIDEEGGTVARLANHDGFELPQYESAAAVGSHGNAADALAMGVAIGGYLKQYGFQMNFAPVADVNTNPENTVIGSRAFSTDAEIASQMADAFAHGLKEQSVIPVFKHFPGHGDTAEDSHTGIAINYKTAEELAGCEWLPYRALTERDCVMVGHIAVPSITGDLTPATLSEKLVCGVLREQLGFGGVIVTDSLAMGAVEAESGDAAILALRAGCDLLLDPKDFSQAFDAVLQAVKSGLLTEARIDESVRRILMLKQAYGILS